MGGICARGKVLAQLRLVLPKPMEQLYGRRRRVLQRFSGFLQRFFKRRLDLVFLSPTKALKAACHAPTNPSTLARPKSVSGEARFASGISGISIHRDVISYPLVNAPRPSEIGLDNSFFNFYFGGLLDPKTQTLIKESNHYRDDSCIQSLPTAYIESYSLDNCIEIRRPCLYGGILFNHFGHFVSESLCRLYAYQMLREVDPFIMFYPLWGMAGYLEKDNYANQILAGFGIPLDRIIFVDQIAKIKEIIIPSQKYGFGLMHRADKVFIEFARTFQFNRKIPRGYEEAEKIYISRSRLRRSGRQVGDKLFEVFLEQEGYKTFYPEQHTLAEQLTVYTSAKRMIFSEGSALLSCILLPDLEAEVAVVCRRRDPTACIRMTTDCLQGYGKTILWIDAVRGQYEFGLNTSNALADIDWQVVSKLLHKHGFIGQSFRALSDEDYLALCKHELREYLHEIHKDPKFIDYMMRFKEIYPPWTGASHQVDPRDGLPVWPPADLK